MNFLLSHATREEIQGQNEEVRQNREILKTFTEVGLDLSKQQELAFRGHDESEDSLNKVIVECHFSLLPSLILHFNGGCMVD